MRLDIITESDGPRPRSQQFILDGEVLQRPTVNLVWMGPSFEPPKLTINDMVIPPPFSVYRDGVPLVIWMGP